MAIHCDSLEEDEDGGGEEEEEAGSTHKIPQVSCISDWAGGNLAVWADHLGNNGRNNQNKSTKDS